MKKTIATLVAALAGLSLFGQAVPQSATEIAAFNWRTNATEEFVLADGGKGVRFKNPAQTVPQEVLAPILAAKEEDLGGTSVWLLGQAMKAGNADASAKLEAIADSTKVREDAAKSANVTIASLATDKAKVSQRLAKLGATDAGARAAGNAATKHSDKRLADDFYATCKGKGVSAGGYRKWFLEQLKAKPTNEQLFDIQQEISGLMRGATSLDTAKPWVEELRYRLYVAKEAAGQ
ncbi:MAG: hypothetical protein IT577_22515 [Verrucomicrobiae bacterium]|nr:hypothetical protein [Verrucomicrobiae bacterium]